MPICIYLNDNEHFRTSNLLILNDFWRIYSFLEVLCHYNAIDEDSLKPEQINGNDIFDVQAINYKVDGLIFQRQEMLGEVVVDDKSIGNVLKELTNGLSIFILFM